MSTARASQRMYNALCLTYGGDLQRFQEFVDRGWLPKKRAQHCGKMFAQLKHAFGKAILPFIDHDLIAKEPVAYARRTGMNGA
jgi:hypothetical protein